MPNTPFVQGTVYENGKTMTFTAFASVEEDGYAYFLRSDLYRCKADGTEPQIKYAKDNRWVKTNNIRDLKVTNFNASGGSGAVAGDANVEAACKWAENIAADDSHGYDQGNRNGPDYDCSSFVGHAFAEGGGFKVNPSVTTRTIVSNFQSAGFTWHAGNPSAWQLVRGDIVVAVGSHTELYIGDGRLCGAHINEFGGTRGGQTGDQTGNEISSGPFYSFPWSGWLHYGG